MASESQLRDDIRRAVREEGLNLPWLEEVLPSVQFKIVVKIPDDPSASALHWRGTVYVKETDVYNGKEFNTGCLPQVLHELFHAYFFKVVSGRSTTLGGQVRDQMTRTATKLATSTRIILGSKSANPTNHDFDPDVDDFKEGAKAIKYFFTRGDDRDEMANEMWGNYIQEVLTAVADLGNWARFDEEAQRMWTDYLDRRGSDVLLTATYVIHKAGKRYAFDPGTPQYIREKLLGVGKNVSSWPAGLKPWTKAYPREIANALRDAGAHRAQDPKRTLEAFVKAWIRATPLNTVYTLLKNPEIVARNRSEAGLKKEGNRVLLVIPSDWADRQPVTLSDTSGGITRVMIFLKNVTADLPKYLGFK